MECLEILTGSDCLRHVSLSDCVVINPHAGRAGYIVADTLGRTVGAINDRASGHVVYSDLVDWLAYNLAFGHDGGSCWGNALPHHG